MHMVESHVPEVSTRVLVVDDDPTFATFVCTIVEREGVRPEVSPTGADAVRRLARGEFAGVLLDLKLPDIDGLTVLGQVRQMGSRVPVIVLTGAANVPAVVRAMKLGALDLLEKPMSVPTLSKAIQALLVASERTNERTNELMARSCLHQDAC